MRLFLAAVLLSATLALSAALSFAAAAEAQFPRGSIIGLVPPEGMSEGRTFAGFEDREKNAALLMVDMPAEAFPPARGELHRRGARRKGYQG